MRRRRRHHDFEVRAGSRRDARLRGGARWERLERDLARLPTGAEAIGELMEVDVAAAHSGAEASELGL